MDIRDLPNVIERLKNYEGKLLSFRSAESPSSLQHEIDIRDLPNSGIKIEQQPKSKKQPEGSEVIFELKVQEQDRYSYQWLKDGAELEGKCDAILILDNVELHQFGWYICRVRSRENFRINCESSRAWLDVVPKVQKGTTLLSSSKRRYALLEFSKQPSYTRNYPRKDMQATLSICLLIFGVCLQGDFCESNKICHGKQYTVKSADGNFEKCQPCGVCNEGWGLEPKCGSTVISPVNETYCQRCHDGITYSDTYDSSPCYMCQHCAEHEIVKTSCTSDTNTKCSGTCEYGYYYNAQDASHACHECSHCCSDGKDEIQTECVRHGLEKRHCSLRMDTNCGPTIKPSISSNTGDSGKFKPIYILYICIGALVGVIILLVAVLLKRRNAGQNNLSMDTNPEQGIKQHEAQPMIHINGRVDPQLDNSNLTTPTQSGKYNHESTQVSSGTTLHPVFSGLNPGYTHSNAGTPRVSPKGTPDLSRQQDGQIKIIQHPTSQKQTERLRVEFSCKCEVPSGTQVLYQWFKDDQELEGKTSDTLLLDSVRMQDFGWYRCQVSCSGDTRMEPVKSGPAELNVTPCPGKKFKTLGELEFETKHRVAMLLENTTPGVGGWREIAHRNGMDDDLVKNLETKQDPGEKVMDFLLAFKPDLQVYRFCKTLKEIKCFNIVKVLEDELVN